MTISMDRDTAFSLLDRFPGFDVLDEADHWDDVTTGLVADRMRSPEPPRFFSLAEEAAADALFDRLLDQRDDNRIPVTSMVDSRLAEQQTDGWRYEDMPEDGEAWRTTLALLDQDAMERYGVPLCECTELEQREIVGGVHALGDDPWHGLPADRVWSLWTRYACTAFYSHPLAWNEIGFPGPAFPRGYAALGVGKREGFEIADAAPEAFTPEQHDQHHRGPADSDGTDAPRAGHVTSQGAHA